MLTNIIPAAVFTAASTAPALSWGDFATGTVHVLAVVFRFSIDRHGMATAAVATALVVLLIGRAFRRDARFHGAIVAARAAWTLTGDPQPGWGPGWAWSGWKPPAEMTQDRAVDEPAGTEAPASERGAA